MRVVLLGPPGSGKGALADRLQDDYGIVHIATGELLRAAVGEDTPLGRQARAAMAAGQLGGDRIVLDSLRERLTRADATKGFILDGFPRNIPQAEALQGLLDALQMPLDAVVLIEADFDPLVRRLSGRRTCEACGAVCNVYVSPPRVDGRCDSCGGSLRQRADDSEDTVANRLRIFDAQTLPLAEYFRRQGKLYRVDGSDGIDSAYQQIKAIIEALPAGKALIAERKKSRRRKAAPKRGAGAAVGKGESGTKAPAKSAVSGKAATRKKAAPKKPAVKKATTKRTAATKAAPKKKATAKKKATPAKKKVTRKMAAGKTTEK